MFGAIIKMFNTPMSNDLEKYVGGKNSANEQTRTFLLSVTMAIICTVLIGVIFSIFVGYASADGTRSQDGDSVPQMDVGDSWTFHEDLSTSGDPLSIGGVTITIDTKVKTITYTVLSVDSSEYKLSVASTITTTGTAEYGTEKGAYSMVQTADPTKSYDICRASDMALKSGHMEETFSMSLMGIQQQGTTVTDISADQPFNPYGFPNGALSIGDEWNVTSTVSATITTTTGGVTQAPQTTSFKYNITSKVTRIVTGAGLGYLNCFEIVRSGAVTAKVQAMGSTKTNTLNLVDNAIYFSTDTKSLVSGSSYDLEPRDIVSYHLVAPKLDLEITSDNVTFSKEYVTVDDPVKITAKISNRGGTAASNINVRFYDGTTKIGEENITSLTGKSSKEVSANWTPTAVGDHTIKVVIDEARAIAEAYENNNKVEINVEVDPRLQYNVRLDGKTQDFIEAGGSLNFTVNVINIGTSASGDTIDIMAINTPTGWTATLSKNTVTLSAGNKTEVTVTVTAPQNVEGGTKVDIVIKGISKGDFTKASLHTVTVTVNTHRGVELSRLQPAKNVVRGGSATYTLIVKNTGNAQDNFDVVAVISNLSTSVQSIQITPTPPIGVGKGASKSVTFTVTTNDTSTIGPLALTVTAMSKSDNNIKSSVVLTTTIEETPSYDVAILLSADSSSLEPGNTTLVALNVKNKGNVNDSVGLEITAEQTAAQSWATMDKTAVSLGNGDEDNIIISIAIPQSALAGNYKYAVKGTSSKSSGTVTSIRYLTITVNRTYGFEVLLAPTAQRVSAGGSANYTFTVKNNGNFADTFDLSVTNLPTGWSKKFILNGNEVNSVTLGPFNTTNIILSLTTSPDATDSYNITIKCVSQSSTKSESVTDIVNIISKGTIDGTITDENNKPIKGATVTVKRDNEIIITTVTDDNGHYNVTVSPGVYNVTISKSGYVPMPKTKKVVVNSGVSSSGSTSLETEGTTGNEPTEGGGFIPFVGAEIIAVIVFVSIFLSRQRWKGKDE
jgi:uncharacterized membrane protein